MEKNMICNEKRVFFALAAGFFTLSFSCASNKEVAKASPDRTVQTSAPQKAEQVPPAPAKEDPPVSPEVQFAQNVSNNLQSGNMEQALALFDNMPAGSEKDSDLQTLKASLLLSMGKGAEAEVLAKELLETNPDDVDVLGLNVMVAKQKGDAKTKSALLKKIITIDPKNADANLELGDEQALRHNYRMASKYYKTAVDSEPTNTGALFSYGKMSYYLEKDSDAKEMFERILAINPDDAQALAYLGKLEGEAKRYRNAKEYIGRALKVEPHNAEFYLDLGTYSRYLGDYKGAESAWENAVKYDPDYFLGYAYLAGLYDEQNNFDKALEYYRKVIEKNPQYYYAYESLGMFAWHKENWAEARNAFSRALQKNPGNVSYVLMIAATYWKEKKIPDLKKFTETAMKGMDRSGLEYAVVRMYHDMGGDIGVLQRISAEQNRTKRGKFLYYAAVYFELKNNNSIAQKYYTEVVGMQSPMFFEYRLAEWSISNGSN